jgi:hypothetical protein
MKPQRWLSRLRPTVLIPSFVGSNVTSHLSVVAFPISVCETRDSTYLFIASSPFKNLFTIQEVSFTKFLATLCLLTIFPSFVEGFRRRASGDVGLRGFVDVIRGSHCNLFRQSGEHFSSYGTRGICIGSAVTTARVRKKLRRRPRELKAPGGSPRGSRRMKNDFQKMPAIFWVAAPHPRSSKSARCARCRCFFRSTRRRACPFAAGAPHSVATSLKSRPYSQFFFSPGICVYCIAS